MGFTIKHEKEKPQKQDKPEIIQRKEPKVKEKIITTERIESLLLVILVLGVASASYYFFKNPEQFNEMQQFLIDHF